MKEQSASFKQVTDGSANIAKRIKLIAASNLENSRSTTIILERIQSVRNVSRDNTKEARNIEGILGRKSEPTPSVKSQKHRTKPRISSAARE